MTKTSAASIRVGSYQLEHRVGEGGSAEVFSAVAPSGRRVAVKLLGPHAELDDNRARARFEREIRLLAEIEHPNLVRLLDSGFDDELGPFLVTELIDGDSLRAHTGGVGPDIAALITAPLAEALAELHQAGLVHRDLKPENVLLTKAGRVVLIDLGLALRPGQTRFTEEGEVTGSLPYMAPEQIEGAVIGPAADVWALAVLFYELSCGRRPFERERPSEEAAAILVGNYERIDTCEERVSPALADWIHRTLTPAQIARPTARQSAAILSTELDWCGGADLRGERRRFVSARESLENEISEHRRVTLRTLATAKGTKPFDSIRSLSRALAYAPKDPQILSELRSIEAKTHAPSENAPSSSRRPRRQKLVAAAVGITMAAAVAVLALTAESSKPAADRSKSSAALNSPDAARSIRTDNSTAKASPSKEADGQSLFEHFNDSIVGNVAENSPSDVAGKRVASGFVSILGRGMAAERGEDGVLRAAEGKPGEPSNAELALDVFGGMLDLAEQGREAQKKQKKATAIPRLEKLSDRDRRRSLALVRAKEGERLVSMAGSTETQIGVALGEIRRKRVDNPDDLELETIEILFQLAGGQEEAGIAHLEAFRKTHPGRARTHFLAGTIALRKGNLKAALAASELALRATQNHVPSLGLRGRVLFLLGRTKSAQDDLRRAVGLDDQAVAPLAYLAELLYSQGKTGASAGAPLVQQLRELTLDDESRASAAFQLERLCKTGIKPAC